MILVFGRESYMRQVNYGPKTKVYIRDLGLSQRSLFRRGRGTVWFVSSVPKIETVGSLRMIPLELLRRVV
jgi:hypothetical protein